MDRQTSFFHRFRLPLLAVMAVVAVGLWYAFRPERLLTNTRVSEAAPAAIADATPLFTGRLTAEAGQPEMHGRVNVLKGTGTQQVLDLTNFATKANGPFALAIAADGGTTASAAQKLGEFPAGVDHQTFDLPAGSDPAKQTTVLLTDAAQHQIYGKATLESF